MGRREQYQYASPCDDVTNRPARTASSRLPPPPAPPAPSPSTGYGTTSARSGITLCNMCNSFSVYFGLRKRLNSVQLYRLDFDNLVTASPPTTGENLGKLAKDLLIKNIYLIVFAGSCAAGSDSVTVVSPSGWNPPVVCGQLSGQHSE